MISFDKAKAIASENYPGAEVVQAFLYKNRFYVFEFYNGTKSYDSPYVSVSRENGMARAISPLDDLDGFFSDLENHQLEV